MELVAEMRSRGISANVHTYSALMNGECDATLPAVLLEGRNSVRVRLHTCMCRMSLSLSGIFRGVKDGKGARGGREGGARAD